MRRLMFAWSCLLVMCGSALGQVGYFSSNPFANTGASTAIGVAGQTGVELTNLTAGDLAGLRVLWILNDNNDGYGSTITDNLTAISNFVAGGGILSFHDRGVGNGTNAILPGAGGISFVRDFTDDANIDIVNNTTLVTNGPGGILNNTSLDGGTSSSHGFVLAASLPAGGVGIFSQTDPTHLVDFYYPFGNGFVYYSSIPMDFYLEGSGPNPPLDNMVNIYAPNEVAFQASLAAVPEPSTLVLSGAAFGSMAWVVYQRSRRGKLHRLAHS